MCFSHARHCLNVRCYARLGIHDEPATRLEGGERFEDDDDDTK